MPDPLAAVAALDGVDAAVERSRAALDPLLRHRALRRSGGVVAVEASLRGALAAAALQDPAVPHDDAALDALRARLREGAEPEGAALRGAVRVAAGLGALVPVWRRAPLQALARLHGLAAADALPAAALGRPRTSALDGAPPPAEAAERLQALAALVAAPTGAPALVVAAVVHGELLAVRPFAWGGALVALAAERLVLADRGLDPRGACVVEAGHLEAGRGYAAAARAYADGDVAGWVRHCGRAVEVGAREGLAVCEGVARAG
ncbi:oxidoreductase [Vallicoccus soli]|uniref:Oxidoreductase n=1 Tax=Vallicoccus soli TaxID=2339232 RepID=A0A3A3Z430_9ACTN|nr:oxidoreductase [Vallicoccus soli]RJK97678.1 oxidoreductase [Vallicoccus soli]